MNTENLDDNISSTILKLHQHYKMWYYVLQTKQQQIKSWLEQLEHTVLVLGVIF